MTFSLSYVMYRTAMNFYNLLHRTVKKRQINGVTLEMGTNLLYFHISYGKNIFGNPLENKLILMEKNRTNC